MKLRAFVLIGILFGLHFWPSVARADFVPPPNNGPRTYSFGDPLGKDVAGTAWKSAGATGPEGLIPGDDTNSTTLKGFSESRLDSLLGTNSSVQAGTTPGGKTMIESCKPIEKVEPRSESDSYVPLATTVAPRKSDGKRILLIAFASVAILGYRKFRRSRAGVSGHKPSFL